MPINYFLHWNEYFAAQEFFRRKRSGIAPEKIIGAMLALLGLVLVLINGLSIFAGLLLLGVALIFGAPLLRRLASKLKWNREPLYHTEHTVAATDEGVYFRMGVIESNLVWHYYQRFIESPDGFLLVYGNDSFNYLPKRAFANEQAIADFRALAQKKLKFSE